MQNKSAFQITVVGVLASGLILSSCAIDPYTGQEKTSNALKGGGIGALAGGLAGALIGNNRSGGKSREGAMIGAAAGALAGLGIGAYMDKQETDIRRQLQGSGVSVTRQGDQLILNMPSDITFQVAQSMIQGQFISTLDAVSRVFKKYSKTNISITGHTDSDGSNSYNQNLSENRARSVADFISSRGVAPQRMYVQGAGESQPIASNDSSSGKARNRRVEIYIIPQNGQF
jgi:outer membrane protein OmpA-like peptidoglycan-associated protein